MFLSLNSEGVFVLLCMRINPLFVLGVWIDTDLVLRWRRRSEKTPNSITVSVNAWHKVLQNFQTSYCDFWSLEIDKPQNCDFFRSFFQIAESNPPQKIGNIYFFTGLFLKEGTEDALVKRLST